MDEVCSIIEAIHRGEPRDTINFKIVHDAILLGALQGRLKKAPEAAEKLGEETRHRLLTEKGKELERALVADVLKDLEKTRAKEAAA